MINTLEMEIAIKRAGLTKKQIAKSIGISDTGLIRKIKNHSEFKANEIEKLCSLLHLSDLEQLKQIFFPQIVDLKSPQSRK